MPRYTTVNVPPGVWTQITDADVTEITFQNVSDFTIWVKGTTNTTAPTDRLGALRYAPGLGDDRPLATLFRGIAAVRVWVFADNGASVTVSHP
jgi:hypothetical protein